MVTTFSLGLAYKLRLRFPKGPIDLSEVTEVHVTIPLELIKCVDAEMERQLILNKSAGTIKVFSKELRKALAPWSPLSPWIIPHLSRRVIRHKETLAIIGVGFTMLRPRDSGKGEGLTVEINSAASPSGGELNCEIVPWEFFDSPQTRI